MDESLKQGCGEIIRWAITLNKEMNLTKFYEKMIHTEIDGKCFATSIKTIQRYLNNKPESGKKYDLFLEYCAKVLGLDKSLIISTGEVFVKSKGTEYEEESKNMIKSVIEKPMWQIEPIESFDYHFSLLDFLKSCKQSDYEKLLRLHTRCLKLSPKMRDFILCLSSDNEKDIQAIASYKRKLKTSRIRVNKLDLIHNKDFCTLFGIQQGCFNIETNLKNTGDLLWTWRFYNMIEENNKYWKLILTYAILK